MNIATIHYIAQPDFINMSLFLFFLNSAKYFIQECTWRGSCKPKNILQKLLQTEKKPKTNEKKKQIQAVQGNCHRQQNLSSLRSEPQSNTEPGFLWFFCLSRCCYNQYID